MTLFYFASVNTNDKEPLLRFSGRQGIRLPRRRYSTTGWRRRARRPAAARRPAGSREAGGDARGGQRRCGRPAGTARGRPPATRESSRVTGAREAGGHGQGPRRRARPAASRDGASPARPRGNLALALASAYSVKKLDRYFYFNCKCCEPLDVLGRWMKGRKLRCDLPQLRY